MKKHYSLKVQITCILFSLVFFNQDAFAQILIDQDFEVGTAVDYVLIDLSNGGTIFPEDVSQAFSAEDYCGRLQVSDLDPADGLDFANIQGTHFFGVNDLDGVDSYPVTRDIVSLNWNNITVNASSTITVSSFIAEGDAADNLEDWDFIGNFTRVRFEYSFDNINWNTMFSIVGDPSGDSANTRPVLDSDNNGTPDLPIVEINEVFSPVEGSFETGTNTTVSIRILMENLTGTDEDIAIDDFMVTQEAVLPVELSYFNVNKLNCEQVEVVWQTESELNSRGFFIERSNDPLEFKNLGFVESSVNSNTQQDYSFKDNLSDFKGNGPLYYRLKQVDLDGTVDFSDIVVINLDCTGKEAKISVFPNPVINNHIHINVEGRIDVESNIVIVNNLNQIITIHPLDQTEARTKIDLSKYAAGIYYIRILNKANSVIFTEKIIVTR